MAKLTSPEVNITFVEKGASAITRSERGVVELVLVDSSAKEATTYTCYTVADIPSTLTTDNQAYISDALKGYQTAPKKVNVYVMPDAETETYKAMMKALERIKWDWFACPTVETDGQAETIATWIKGLRSTEKLMRKAVLPNQAADNEGVVNVVASIYDTDGTEITPEQLTPRIAGLICGTPMNISATYAPLNEYSDCTRYSKDDADAAVGAGKLIFIFDGEKVKLNRAVNSLCTTTDTKGDSYKKIKIVETMDMIYDDIRSTCEDSYIGKFANSYDNKCLLITAIQAYFNELIRSTLLQSASVSIDLEAQKNYLMSQGEDVDNMTDDEIKEANTGSHVFLRANISILDAMEDIDLEIDI